MISINEFAKLCSCSTQTLRYYDRVGLLSPARVDEWTLYRYYEPVQAMDFVKIKSLQQADFSIAEIKKLLTMSDEEVFAAFEQKIAAQEAKLERMIQIQKTYLREKNIMQRLIDSISGFVLKAMGGKEELWEFGLREADAERVARLVQDFIEKQLSQALPGEEKISMLVDEELVHGADNVCRCIDELDAIPAHSVILGGEELSGEELFDRQQHNCLWECSGWAHVRDFIDSIPPLENDGEYTFAFELEEDKYREDVSFPMLMLGAMLLRKGENKLMLGCSVEKSPDGVNRFALLKKR